MPEQTRQNQLEFLEQHVNDRITTFDNDATWYRDSFKRYRKWFIVLSTAVTIILGLIGYLPGTRWCVLGDYWFCITSTRLSVLALILNAFIAAVLAYEALYDP